MERIKFTPRSVALASTLSTVALLGCSFESDNEPTVSMDVNCKAAEQTADAIRVARNQKIEVVIRDDGEEIGSLERSVDQPEYTPGQVIKSIGGVSVFAGALDYRTQQFSESSAQDAITVICDGIDPEDIDFQVGGM